MPTLSKIVRQRSWKKWLPQRKKRNKKRKKEKKEKKWGRKAEEEIQWDV